MHEVIDLFDAGELSKCFKHQRRKDLEIFFNVLSAPIWEACRIQREDPVAVDDQVLRCLQPQTPRTAVDMAAHHSTFGRSEKATIAAKHGAMQVDAAAEASGTKSFRSWAVCGPGAVQMAAGIPRPVPHLP